MPRWRNSDLDFLPISEDGFLRVDNSGEVDNKSWAKRWPNFKPQELDSDDFSLVISVDALDALQRVRDEYGKPMRVTCAYRNPRHNKRVGGRPGSSHLAGVAFDIAIPNTAAGKRIEKLAVKHGFTGIGRYPSRLSLIHI